MSAYPCHPSSVLISTPNNHSLLRIGSWRMPHDEECCFQFCASTMRKALNSAKCYRLRTASRPGDSLSHFLEVVPDARRAADFLDSGLRELVPVSYTPLRAHETRHELVCRLLLEKKKK